MSDLPRGAFEYRGLPVSVRAQRRKLTDDFRIVKAAVTRAVTPISGLAALEHRHARLLDPLCALDVVHDVARTIDAITEPDISGDRTQVSAHPILLALASHCRPLSDFRSRADEKRVVRPTCVGVQLASRSVAPAGISEERRWDGNDKLGVRVAPCVPFFALMKARCIGT
jgi:hypothetical protein